MLRVDLPVFATLSLGVGPLLFARGFRDLNVRRLIQNTPTARIRSLAMGLVEINGKVIARSQHDAPFSGRPCAYWEVDIAVRSRKNAWTIVHRSRSGSPFFVRDDTGLAFVYPEGSQCRVQSGVEETCVGISLPDCYARYMSDQRLALRSLWRLSVMRFRERTLEDGQHVYVLGTAEPRSRAREVSMDDALAATGTDGPVQERLRTLTEEVAAVVRRGSNDRTFIISSGSERQLTTDLALSTFGKLVAGPALTLFGLGYWLVAR